jgi:hypothetical protein
MQTTTCEIPIAPRHATSVPACPAGVRAKQIMHIAFRISERPIIVLGEKRLRSVGVIEPPTDIIRYTMPPMRPWWSWSIPNSLDSVTRRATTRDEHEEG